MKKTITSVLFLSTLHFLFAQTEYSIHLKQKIIEPKENIVFANQTQFANQLFEDHLYLLLQFRTTISPQQQRQLQEYGIEILRYLNNLAFVARIPNQLNTNQLQQLGIRHISNLTAENKIAPLLKNSIGEVAILVKLYRKEDRERGRTILGNLGELLYQPFLPMPNALYLKTNTNQLNTIAALPFVEYVQKAYPSNTFVDENLASQRAHFLKRTPSLNLSGDGVTVGVGDGGTVNNHLDLNDRIINRNEIDDSGHGTRVTGIIAGEGILDYLTEGFAPSSIIIADYFGNMVSKAGDYVTNNGMSLANHSYGTFPDDIPFCDFTGDYDIYSQNIDQTTEDYPNLLHFIAAGNSGTTTCAPYPLSYNTVFNGIQAAKNVITVGATSFDDVIASFSSRGPTTDGRIKPEVVGVGVGVRSPSTQQSYVGATNGTSFSAPSVTGTAALLTQLYKNQHNDSLPEAALLKAILCNSADDLGNAGPDYFYGFGRVNAYSAAKIIAYNQHISDTISNEQTPTYTISIPSGVKRVKVMLCWTDLAASPLSPQSLINNLDIEIIAPDATSHYPWLLDTAATQVANLAYRASAIDRDSINSIEQITIENPIAGNYDIRILGTMIPMGVQKFHIVYEIEMQELVLTHPIGGEVFLPNDNLLITWDDTTGFQNDTLALYYSADNGLNWTAIDTTILPDKTQYNFNLPAITSEEMLIRIRNKDNTFTDTSATFTIMDRTSLTALPNCNEGVELTWTSVTDASNYQVFMFATGSWHLIHTTAGTSHTISGLNLGEEYCFTVKAISSGGIEGGNAIGKCVTIFGNTINSFPYQEDFEEDDGNWTTSGKNTDWEWGIPNNTLINQAAEGNKAWVTNLDSNYRDAGLGFLFSPCFDLSNLTTPVLSFAMWKDIEEDSVNLFDYAQVHYSTNGSTWTRLGVNGGGYHWYNHLGGQHTWDGTDSCWHQARYNIPTTASGVRFRILLNSDPFVNQEGIGIDNVYIYDASENDHFVLLQCKIALEGAFDSSNNLMHDSLRTQNQLPLQQPYSSIFTHSGNEEITDLDILNLTGNDAIVDWVFLELRNLDNSNTVLATRAALVQRDGDVVEMDGISPVKFEGMEANDFFIAVKYRNHLGVMTDAVVELANILIGE